MAREGSTKKREWEYWPGHEGEPFIDKDGNEVLGWHDRSEKQDERQLLAEFEAFYAHEFGGPQSLTLRPILMRIASDVECRINGWEEGSMVRCTTRAKKSWPMWQVEIAASTPQPADQQTSRRRIVARERREMVNKGGSKLHVLDPDAPPPIRRNGTWSALCGYSGFKVGESEVYSLQVCLRCQSIYEKREPGHG